MMNIILKLLLILNNYKKNNIFYEVLKGLNE